MYWPVVVDAPDVPKLVAFRAVSTTGACCRIFTFLPMTPVTASVYTIDNELRAGTSGDAPVLSTGVRPVAIFTLGAAPSSKAVNAGILKTLAFPSTTAVPEYCAVNIPVPDALVGVNVNAKYSSFTSLSVAMEVTAVLKVVAASAVPYPLAGVKLKLARSVVTLPSLLSASLNWNSTRSTSPSRLVSKVIELITTGAALSTGNTKSALIISIPPFVLTIQDPEAVE